MSLVINNTHNQDFGRATETTFLEVVSEDATWSEEESDSVQENQRQYLSRGEAEPMEQPSLPHRPHSIVPSCQDMPQPSPNLPAGHISMPDAWNATSLAPPSRKRVMSRKQSPDSISTISQDENEPQSFPSTKPDGNTVVYEGYVTKTQSTSKWSRRPLKKLRFTNKKNQTSNRSLSSLSTKDGATGVRPKTYYMVLLFSGTVLVFRSLEERKNHNNKVLKVRNVTNVNSSEENTTGLTFVAANGKKTCYQALSEMEKKEWIEASSRLHCNTRLAYF